MVRGKELESRKWFFRLVSSRNLRKKLGKTLANGNDERILRATSRNMRKILCTI
ncbi:hypothetical protein LEP1GSC036_0763 [Leptospira weilii str. 2006001853]|uniref:Uncharacterized protein n=4 Tax=Leptospira weilii TaxID=28184 RepID=A0A828Z6J8_9LEPT|nr:hypothetical protein LEP1GSC036_0763 [Leptospira weilii str. 2006001853]EMJ62690.1 hypothetical protein LEP1GSC051_3927 [Leptospira sp. P2653]EMM74985.1 hypothetical protein LEP1GSC038_0918 [Leptospira weilii str. 2006001855]EMN46724.1 hypothetical protein LEP1GSC086_4079 [Leptospira weilii str. LNT 1234]EMN90681.1 hypothetical protein LEP1GSC108_2331 [Leptospira weilii str. UI 13098]EMY12278.1 hypothetical protein LEP1GSC043_3612 [Leptospira weilii str. Ecochallenge]